MSETENDETSASSSDVYKLVLDYSYGRPPWERDIMRRYVDAGELTADDYSAAVAMCKASHDVEVESPPPPLPLTTKHLPSMGASTLAVSLASLYGFAGVNALVTGETLEFAPTGLTTIFGLNGAGKSGYARVLKHLCRARGNLPSILPNQFDSTGPTPEAGITYRCGTTEENWHGSVNGKTNATPDALSQVCVHDSESAAAYFSGDQPVEVMPAGLDILMSLKNALDYVKAALEKENEGDTRAAGFPELQTDTDAGRFLATLSAETSDDLVASITNWSAEHEDALTHAITKIAELQAGKPEKRARELVQKAGRLSGLSARLETLAVEGDATIEARVVSLLERLEATSAAYDVVRGLAFDDGQLPGTGSAIWQELWKAAARFSFDEAYEEKPFPHTDEGARCVLCQQDFDSPTHARMRSFNEFMEGSATRALTLVRDEIDHLQSVLGRAIVPAQVFPQPLRDEVVELDDLLPERIDAFIEAATTRRRSLLLALKCDTTLSSIPPAPTLSAVVLDQEATAARAEAEALIGEPATDTLDRAMKLRRDLEAQKRLHHSTKLVRAEIARLERTRRRAGAARACNTSSVSSELGNLTKKFVTDALVDTFNSELQLLGGGKLRVALKKANTRKGVSYTRLVLRESVGEAALPRLVFSEGEKRLVSLAAFLAELSVGNSTSAIVFDDPATSLDHRHRTHIAGRLVQESVKRQVILFTHDLAFLHMLSAASERISRNSSELNSNESRLVLIERLGGRPGHCSDRIPWEGLSLRKRLGRLKELVVNQVAKKQTNSAETEYREFLCSFYNNLRKTWERAVEDALFNGTVTRFGAAVQTQRLKSIDLTKDDINSVFEGMEVCNTWAHDNPCAGDLLVPDRDQVARDTNLLLAWLLRVRERRIRDGLGSGSIPNTEEIPLLSG